MENTPIQETIDLLAQTWTGVVMSAGISAGIFDTLNIDMAISAPDIAQKLKYNLVKVENWLNFMELYGFLSQEKEGYKLTEKGFLLTEKSKIKELTGLLQLTDFYMNAAIHAKDTFKTNDSLDKISDGKITGTYQPKVSDNFSISLIEMLHRYHITTSDTLLDIGCGSGTFLRMVTTKIPDIKVTGLEANLFVIERGKKLNLELGLSNRIVLMAGDINKDLADIPNNSYDWVTAINIFHFIPEEKRMVMVDNMLRIAKKGILATQTICESTPLAGSANVLMFLLWNDFTGFFRKAQLDIFNKTLHVKYQNHIFEMTQIMHGQSNLLAILKK
jgi:ubiquinone/menaquinone biosynthesis C-methylase UbiE